jgi:hypothetical protein
MPDACTHPSAIYRKAAQALNTIAISPEDVARAVTYALNQPANVTVNDLIISSTRQDWRRVRLSDRRTAIASICYNAVVETGISEWALFANGV